MISEHVKLEASDGHELDAYVAHPKGGPIAGLVVGQEIFGVNRHIRSVADDYAKVGKITPTVAKQITLEAIPKALERLAEGHVRGKIVARVQS